MSQVVCGWLATHMGNDEWCPFFPFEKIEKGKRNEDIFLDEKVVFPQKTDNSVQFIFW